MSKVRDISGLANIIKTDANGNVTFVSGSTTLMAISSSGAVTSTGTIGGSNSATLATTGSNTFTGQQYVSNTNAPVNFTDTASLYTDGGLRVGKDAYVSGTLYLNNLTVYGTQSVNYITSSQLDISDNIITVNTSTPQIRFGGIAVRDSGSEGTGLTGSLLWDSQNNHWVYTNPSGSSYSGGMMISGPRASSLGEEQGTTFNALMKGQGGDHITSSAVFEVSGSVGIGLSNPSNKLEVQAGDIKINANISSTASLYFGITGTNYGKIQYNDSNQSMFITTVGSGFSGYDLNLGTKDNIRLSILGSNGNVGIGNTSPDTKLHISASDGIKIQATGNSDTPSLTIINNTNQYGWARFGGGLQGNGKGYANISCWNGSTIGEVVRISGDGNVGIGVASTPEGLLDVYKSNSGGLGGHIMLRNNGSAVGNEMAVMFVDGGAGSARAAISSTTENSPYYGDIKFKTGAGTYASLTTRMIITGEGKIRVNSSTSNGIFDIYRTPVNSNYVKSLIVQGTGYYPSLQFGTYDAYDGFVATAGNDLRILAGLDVYTENHSIMFYTSFNGSSVGAQNYERVRINHNGEFLIGTTTATSSDPVHRIGLNGGTTYGRLMLQERVGVWLSLNTGTTNYGTVYLNGSVVVYGGQSDYRLKENIQPMSSGLDRVMNLKPVTFNWKRDNSYGEGFIAHELQEVVPLAVTGTKDGLNEVGDPDWQNVDKSHIVPILVKAIQEQQAQINELKAQING
jgi:hypothetical protein